MRAAALLAGLVGLWIILYSAAPLRLQDVITGGGVALAIVLVTARLGGVDADSVPHFRLLRLSLLHLRRAWPELRGAGGVVRRAIAADVNMRPALVRVRTRPQSNASRATFVQFVSAHPGGLVIDVDNESVLAHVLHEDGLDGPALARLESDVIRAVDGAGA